MMENACYFILKALFVLKIFKFFVFLVTQKNGLIRKIRLISKYTTSQPGKQTITINENHIALVWALTSWCREKIFTMVDLIIKIASELLTLLKIIEFLTGLAVILSYEKNLFF